MRFDKRKTTFFLLFLSLSFLSFFKEEDSLYSFEKDGYKAVVFHPLPKIIQKRIYNKSWKKNNPVPMKDLSYIQFIHINFEGKDKLGEMIVHKKIAKELLEIFYELYLEKYPIHQCRLVDDYNAEDEASMQANNSSAFCSRENLSRPGIFSKHSYGIAIDINPKFNPYYNYQTGLLAPKGSEQYMDRTLHKIGMIYPEDACYKAFTKRGFVWGGSWTNRVDYHHFEKKFEDVL